MCPVKAGRLSRSEKMVIKKPEEGNPTPWGEGADLGAYYTHRGLGLSQILKKI
jgi:hypothetical protein